MQHETSSGPPVAAACVAFVAALAAACGGGRAGEPAAPGAPLPEATPRRARAEHPEDRAAARTVDALSYVLQLDLDPAERALSGTATVTLAAREALAEVRLDAQDLTVGAVRDGAGAPLQHRTERGQVVVELGAPAAAGAVLTLAVDYSARPQRGLVFVGEPADHCFTQGQCDDARAWFPCVDHPSDRATFELAVALPSSWSAVSNGARIAADDVGGRRRERWRTDVPIPTYLVSLVAGELTSLSSVVDGLGYQYLAPRRALGGLPDVFGPLLEPNLGVTPRVITFLEDFTGRAFPFTKYATACVGDFPFGGMENASATTLGINSLRGALARKDGDAEGLIVHEAAHQWFGDLLTCAEWPEVWLNEGFATYCSLMWLEARDGREAFELALRDAIEVYLDGDSRAPRALVHREYREPFDLFFTGHAYQGGAARLHMLRERLGEAAFRAGVRRYVGRMQHRAVETADFRAALEEAARVNLGAFFEDWVLAPGHPELEVSARFDAARSRLLLRVDQVHALAGGVPAVFRGPIVLALSEAGAPRELTLELSRRRDVFDVPCSVAPDWVLLDPHGVWPARIRHTRDVAELTRVVRSAPRAVARREAVRELAVDPRRAPADEEAARAALIDVLTADPTAPVRAAAATALTQHGDGASAALALAAREDVDHSVRRAALTALAARAAAAPTPAPAALVELARTLVHADEAPIGVRGAAARLLAVAAGDSGVASVVALAEASRPRAEDPHGALAGALWEALAPTPERARRAARSASGSDTSGVLRATLRVTEVALDAARPSGEREGAAAALAAASPVSDAARRALAELLVTAPVRVQRAAVVALARDPGADARALLADQLRRTRDPRQRITIERSLGR